MNAYRRTLFLHPPSFDGFDGGAGSRYQARREIRSFWYPTWLAQPAALVPGSRLVDAPPEGLTAEDVVPLAAAYELAVLHTSTPSFEADVRVAAQLKQANPSLQIGFVGAHVAVNPDAALSASGAIDFVARNEFDFTIRDVAEGRSLERIPGLSFRAQGRLHHTPDRPVLEDMDALPFVVDVYKRDLVIEHYAIGYLLHPYVSLYTGRGCRSKCTFCLWPQTVGGQRYRTRSVEHVAEEIARAVRYFPQVREYFFDDDTLTDDLPRVEALARCLGRLGVTWSCNAKANVPYDTLKVLKDNGLRLLLVGYESGNQQIVNNVRKGIRLDVARRFTRHAKDLGIKIHGTFILGLPGETPETIQESIRFARELDPDTIQVSIAAPYPGTELFRQATNEGWLGEGRLVDARGTQLSALSYPHLLSSEIFRGTEEFYRRFYFRPRKMFSIAREMIADGDVMRRRLREGREFLTFLRARRDAVAPESRSATALIQAVIVAPAEPTSVAGVAAVVRAAVATAEIDRVARVIVVPQSTALPDAWQRQLHRIRVPWTAVTDVGALGDVLDSERPVLVLAAGIVPDPALVSELLARHASARRPSTWLSRGQPAATYYPQARALLARAATPDVDPVRTALTDPDARRMPAPTDAWSDVRIAEEAQVVERRLVAALHRPSDGYLARLDRRISTWLSRRLARTPITPNALTTASLLVGLAGAAVLAGYPSPVALLGVALLWASSILDGCDGEVARLTLTTSAAGGRFDIATDHVIHAATFAAIVVHLERFAARWISPWPVAGLFVGVGVSMLVVARAIHRETGDRQLGLRRVCERIASRDYVYVLMLLTFFGHLDWFVWAAAIGANLFWVILWTATRRRRTE